MPRADTAGRIAAGAAVLFALGYHVLFTVMGPLNFDEAYNLQVPLNLHLNGRYQTWYDEPQQFPHQITTGPSVLLPIAALFAVTGPTFHAARAVMTLFMIGYLWQTWVLARRLTGRAAPWVFAAATILFALVPLAPWLSSIVLGEIPGVFCVLLAVNLMWRAIETRRHGLAFASGVALGLAALCKVVLLICAVGVFPALVLCSELRGRRLAAFRLGALCFVGLLLPIAAWEGAKASILGWDLYLFHIERFRALMEFGGSGLARDGSLKEAPSVAAHLDVIAKELDDPAWAVQAGLGLASAATLWVLARGPRPFALLSLTLGAAVYWAWWLRLSIWLSLRHLLVGYLLYALTIALVGGLAATRPGMRQSTRALLLAMLAIAVVLTLPPWRPLPAPWKGRMDLANQRFAAGWVRAIQPLAPQNTFWSYGWHQAPDISFLAQVPFRDITRHTPAPTEFNFLVISSFYSGYVGHLDYANRYCDKRITRGRDVRICRLRPDAPRAPDTTIRP